MNRNAAPRSRRDSSSRGTTRDTTTSRAKRRDAPAGRRSSERAEEPIGIAKEELTDWPTFRLIRIEQAQVRSSLTHERALPAEIPRILNAGIHPLRADRLWMGAASPARKTQTLR
jgi:hypothetical protein